MKHRFFGLVTVVGPAILVSAHIGQKDINTTNLAKKATAVPVYFIYNGGPHNLRSSYTEVTSYPGNCLGEDYLCWFRIDDNNGTVTNTEFDTAFEVIDRNNDNSNSLDDDVEGDVFGPTGISYELMKKTD